jgi:hypothetical protein
MLVNGNSRKSYEWTNIIGLIVNNFLQKSKYKMYYSLMPISLLKLVIYLSLRN